MGFLALRNQDYQEAVNIFNRELESGATAEGYFGLGKAFYHLHELPTARWAFYKALELQPDNQDIVSYIDKTANQQNPETPPRRQSSFRCVNGRIEVHREQWVPFFVKGMNLGLGLPGYFPGEYAIRKGTYMKWLRQMADLGVNAIRLYTVHPPSFYEALGAFNTGSPKKLYLLQGTWAELPEGYNFLDAAYASHIQGSVRDAVDAVFGNARLPERPGLAHGRYSSDVSAYTIGFIFGREWESCAVKGFNELNDRRMRDYVGRHLFLREGTPFEVWTIEMCDYLQAYEAEKYGHIHPVSATSWPTLDPLVHGSESKYEDELALQGLKVRSTACNENEDAESLDFAKVSVKDGAGFFVTYHAYPYYPDFMNNDYLTEENTYLAYLRALKNHHAAQAILIAEFGVPSSREVCHWHRDGWHHGGHSENDQGHINGVLMKTIHEAGLAGGALFGWFDEWFKRNWLFLPYELPAERNPLWFNLQDAEQNYGLLAMYPGYPDKKVSLAGRAEEWQDAVIYASADAASPLVEFGDGFDGARSLCRLAVQHDEAFLYLLLETRNAIDFAGAHYLIGIDTGKPDYGEFLLSFRTNYKSPVGLKFLIHLAGRDKSRILVCRRYDKYFNSEKQEVWPAVSDQGEWVMMFNKTNSRRAAKDGSRFYPARVFPMSNLRFGSLDRKHPEFDSLADFFVNGNMIEMRIPWGLINFTDPSSGSILWKTAEGMTVPSDGIRFVAVSYKPDEGALGAVNTGRDTNVTDHLPRQLTRKGMPVFSWTKWNTPIYHSYLKSSYYTYQKILAGIPETE